MCDTKTHNIFSFLYHYFCFLCSPLSFLIMNLFSLICLCSMLYSIINGSFCFIRIIHQWHFGFYFWTFFPCLRLNSTASQFVCFCSYNSIFKEQNSHCSFVLRCAVFSFDVFPWYQPVTYSSKILFKELTRVPSWRLCCLGHRCVWFSC